MDLVGVVLMPSTQGSSSIITWTDDVGYAPRMRVILRKLELVLGNDVGELVEDDEPYRTVVHELSRPVASRGETPTLYHNPKLQQIPLASRSRRY